MRISHPDPERLVKRIFLLAYNACGGPLGMGVLQARNGATEEDIWKNVSTQGDYPGGGFRRKEEGSAYGDYVFGRMMKLSVKFDGEGIEVSDRQPTADYQSWSRQYPSYQSLVEAAVKSLNAEATKTSATSAWRWCSKS